MVEWQRDTTNAISRSIREIDSDLSQINKDLNDVEQAMVRTAMMGGTLAKKEIAEYNEDYDSTCTYCKEAESTADHIRWECKYFQPQREELDPELAGIPLAYLPQCVRCGVAPAMKVNGEKTYWGMDVGETISGKMKKLLGVDLELQTPGDNAKKTAEREEALDITLEPEMNGKNARQLMLAKKLGRP